MSDSTHTPGPWRWIDDYDHHEHEEHQDQGLNADCENIRHGRIKLVDNEGGSVLDVWALYADDQGVTAEKPDLLLIQAAPDLLEALKSIIRTCEKSLVPENKKPWEPIATACYLAQKSIWKAEGK